MWTLAGALGTVPREVVEGADVSDTCDGEWSSRMVRWALEPVTGVVASEHVLSAGVCVLCGEVSVVRIGKCRGLTCACKPCMVVCKRANPSVPLFVVEVSGCAAGHVSAVTASY